MRVEIHNTLPAQAAMIREEVFIKEQGFEKEYDETDKTATHIVLLDSDTAVATCRVFKSETPDVYILGRLAVKKEYRGRGIGSLVLEEAGRHILSVGGKAVILHSQLHAKEFYEKCGFAEYGEIEYEQGCPHIWMKKQLG